MTVEITGRIEVGQLKAIEIIQNEMEKTNSIEELQNELKTWRVMTPFNGIYVYFGHKHISLIDQESDKEFILIS